MRYIYILIGIVLAVLFVIVFFQNYRVLGCGITFFNKFIMVRNSMVIMFFMGFFSGFFFLLGVKGILSKGKDTNDSFDL